MEKQSSSLHHSAPVLESIQISSFRNYPFPVEKPNNFWLSHSGRDYSSTPSQKFDIRRMVMICDDEADVLTAYKIALSSKYSVVTTTSGRDCLTKYNEQQLLGRKVDVLILDYKLGDMLGDEVACKIQEIDGTKVILISAYEIDPDFLKDLERRNCITSFVRKPVSMASLLSKVDQVLLG
jgi:response regulator RpfG family c-di-GMP phosphodiesterase